MESKERGTKLQDLLSYDDIEPLCTWQRADDQDVLVILLPEFKKEQLRIQISNTGLLKITGERVVDGKKRSRFVKDVKVTKDYDSNNIHAKFSQGCLRVTFPKKAVTPSSISKTPSTIVTSPPEDGKNDCDTNTNEKTVVPGIQTRVGRFLKSKTPTQVMMTVVFATVVAFNVYITYKYWTTCVQR